MANTHITTNALSNTYDLSANGTLSVGGHILKGFKSGSISFDAASVDNSTRDDQGWTADAPGKRSASLDITFNKISSPSVSENETITWDNEAQQGIFELLLASDFMSTGVPMIYRSAEASAVTGFSGVFVLSSYSESQQSDGTAVEVQTQWKSFETVSSDASNIYTEREREIIKKLVEAGFTEVEANEILRGVEVYKIEKIIKEGLEDAVKTVREGNLEDYIKSLKDE